MPDWGKLVSKALDLVKGAQKPEQYIAPHCLICGQEMRRLQPDEPTILKWRYSDDAIYRCPQGHEFSPGNYAEGVKPLPPSGAGPTGEV